MVIETGIMSKEYAADTTNVMLSDLALERNPRYKIKNQRVLWIIYTCACFVIFLSTLSACIMYKSIYMAVCACIVALCFFVGVAFIRKSVLLMNQLSSLNRKVTYTFSAEGIEYDSKGTHKVTFYWDYFQAVRVYGAGVYFIPKKKGTSILGMPVEYEYDVRAYIEENNIPLEFYQ